MDLQVFLQTGRVTESLSALRTLVRLFPAVELLVCPEIGHLRKGISAMRTLVRLFRGVCGPMDGEI